jgi:hypothetical protein
MKKSITFFLFFIIYSLLSAQTEKGMWMMNGKIFSNSSISTDKQTNSESHLHYIKADIGYFMNKKNLIGTRLLFHFHDRNRRNFLSQRIENIFEFTSELSSFYRYYPFPDKKLGFFGEGQASLLGNSLNINAFYGQFRTQIGAGAYIFFRPSLAMELSFSKPFYQTAGLTEMPKLVANFSITRNFKGPQRTQLPKLEDTYLFVRNFYYGLGYQRNYKESQSGSSIRTGSQFLVNAGFFVSSNWLIDLEYSIYDYASAIRRNIFIDLRLESAFFIRLNGRGTYLRPSASFKLENNGRFRHNNNPDLFGFRKNSYIGNLELTQFLGDQVIIGGGGTFGYTKYGPEVDYLQFNASLRLSYFVTKDFAIEYKGSFYIHDKLINRTGNDVILDLTNVNAEVKIRHFFFQK